MSLIPESKSGFSIYIDTICDGAPPVKLDEKGYPVIYETLLEAQRVIAESTTERLQQFLSGERDFEDAMTVDRYIVPVDVWPDGLISDEAGNVFGAFPL